MLCYQVFSQKKEFTARNWSDLYNFNSKVIFTFFFLLFFFTKIVFIFLADFKLSMFHNNIVKISGKCNKQNLLKVCLKVTCPTDFCTFCILHPFLLRGNVKIFDFEKTNDPFFFFFFCFFFIVHM